MQTSRFLYNCLGVALLPALLTGCEGWGKAKDPVAPRPAGTMSDLASFTAANSSAALEGTIGAVAYLQGDRMMRVRGYGLVVGLGGKGSGRSMPSIREYLAKEIRRVRLTTPHVEFPTTPEQLIDSPDSAVVEVAGEIPAGASKGQVFDVYVSAASFDPDTQSIAGGYLLLCDLKLSRESSPQEIIEGRTLARARGPVFVNPFLSRDGSTGASSPREGRVLGGGTALEDRDLSLVTAIESYATVRQIMDAINRRFISDPKAADAISPTNVKLRIPKAYRGRERRFIELVMHLSLAPSTSSKEARCKQLAAEMVRPDAPVDNVGLSLEGIGPLALPLVKSLYTHNRREVNFYAARTGIRLGDDLALEVIARHAKDDKSPFRAAAIRELGDCGMTVRAGTALRGLLLDSDPRIRILAYEALRRVEPDSIETRTVGHEPENFILDIVPSEGPTLVYARRTGTRRLALIGGDRLVVHPPFLYADPGKPIVVSAVPEDKMVSVIKKDLKGKIILGPMRIGPSLPDFAHFLGHDPKADMHGQLQGLGMDYAVVLDVLYRLCEKGSVNADFRWEEPGIEDLVGPLAPTGRPESEL